MLRFISGSILSLFIFSSCGDDSSSSGSGSGSSDATSISSANFDPKMAPALNEVDVDDAMELVQGSRVVNFFRKKTASTLALNLAKNQMRLPGEFELDDSVSECIDKTRPDVDVIRASGNTASQIYHEDWSKCFYDAAANAGGTTSVEQCDISIAIELTCPGMDYSAANGSSANDAEPILKDGMLDCKLKSGDIASVTAKIAGRCAVSRSVNGRYARMDQKMNEAVLGSDGKACLFNTFNNVNVFGDCIEGSARISTQTIDGKTTNSHYVSRVKLSGAMQGRTLSGILSGANLPLEVNDWSGDLSMKNDYASYTLRQGSKTKTGTINF